MTETDTRSPPEGGAGTEGDSLSPGSVLEAREPAGPQVTVHGTCKVLEGMELTENESRIAAQVQEQGLFLIGLVNMGDWAQQIPPLIDEVKSMFANGELVGHGDSKLDSIIDQICGDYLDPEDLRKKLIRTALSVPHGK